MENMGETLYEYTRRLSWVKRLGRSDDELRQIPVHQSQSIDEPFLSLPLENLQQEEGIDGLYVYKSEVPPDLWDDLVATTAGGGRSGRAQTGMYGDKPSLDEIPRPY